MENKRTWLVAATDSGAVSMLCRELGLHRLTATRLVELGFDTAEKAQKFLSDGVAQLPDPFRLLDMDKAVQRLAQAAKAGEQVLVYGDYDADGVTATALLLACFRRLGLKAEYYIPSRLTEGYGLHMAPLARWAAAGGRLVVSVDCGSNDFASLEYGRQLGLDIIVTDHHEVLPGERAVAAFVNPRQNRCPYPDKNLAGVGVAWNLAMALSQSLGLSLDDSFLQHAALGTVADVVPLLSVNRVLVREGLKQMAESPLPGIAALAQVAGLSGAGFTATRVAFALAPRINAAGRVGDAAVAVELLLSSSPAAAEEKARELEQANRERQKLESQALQQAREQARGQENAAALVLWHRDWHPGVVGVVAGRIAEEFGRPSVLISLAGTEGQGSARSVPGFDILSCLQECSDYLTRFGGHRLAAGLTIPRENLEAFREKFVQAAASCMPKVPPLSATAVAETGDLTVAVARELARLEPFGEGNEEPLFLLPDLEVQGARQVGALQNHLQIRFGKDGRAIDSIYFNGGGFAAMAAPGRRADVLFHLREECWQGQSYVKLYLRDIRLVRQAPAVLHETVVDYRNQEVQNHVLNSLAGQKRLLVWANTAAAVQWLAKRYGRRLDVLHAGRGVISGPVDAMLFYHLPFNRQELEAVLRRLAFLEKPCFYLLFGQKDLSLNERIFAAGVPDAEFLQTLAGKTMNINELGEMLQGDCSRGPFPLTGKLLERTLRILAEAGSRREGQSLESWLANSATYREGIKKLDEFRRFQHFLLFAPPAQISLYLSDPENYVFPGEAWTYEPGRIKKTN